MSDRTVRYGAVSGWTKIFEGEADGPPINTPFELDTFQRDPDDKQYNLEGGTPLSTPVERGGRLLISRQHNGTLEIMPLFSDSGATASVQVWGFEPINPMKVPSPASDSIIIPTTTFVLPSNGEPGLGMSYNVLRDTGGSPETLELSQITGNPQQAMSFTDDMHPYWTDDSDVYYVGYRTKLDVSGMFAVMPWVTVVSSGTLILLGRYL